jgi:hypothetical protein
MMVPKKILFFNSIDYLVSVCSLVHQRRVQGIFGPPYPELATLVHSICYHVDIPFINVCSSCYDVESPEEEASDDAEQTSRRDRMSINLYPSNQDLNIAFYNLTHKLQWTKFLIIYDMDSGKDIYISLRYEIYLHLCVYDKV